MTGVQIPPLEPGSEPWLRVMSASKIAAVVGLSPWESRFSLWHRMAGLIGAEDESDRTRRGHYLEAAICEWFADQHPAWGLTEGGCWQRDTRPLHVASPDRMVLRDDGRFVPMDAKTAGDDEAWGPSGTDEIPPYYRAQLVWQMHCTGANAAHVAVLTARLEFREYEIGWDQDEADWLILQADEFLASLPDGPGRTRRPDIDEHGATYRAVRAMHPDIDPVDVDVAATVARRYLAAVASERRAKARRQKASAVLLDRMGRARRAVHDGQTVATRTPGRPGEQPRLMPTRTKGTTP